MLLDRRMGKSVGSFSGTSVEPPRIEKARSPSFVLFQVVGKPDESSVFRRRLRSPRQSAVSLAEQAAERIDLRRRFRARLALYRYENVFWFLRAVARKMS